MKRYKKAYVEITNICNLKCDFCPDTKRSAEHMKKAAFTRVADEVKQFTDFIYFHLMGEPLLNPELEELLRICSEKQLKVNITTNGTLLGRQKEVLVNSQALRKVSISLHSYEANCKNCTLEDYLAQSVAFVEEASSKGIICQLRLWNGDGDGIKASNQLNDEIIALLQLAFRPGVELAAELEQRQNIKLKDNVYLNLAQKFEWPDIDRAIIGEDVFCYGLRDQFGILVDGTVVPCCLDNEGSISLGNIFRQPLAEILSSNRAKSIYDGFTKRVAIEELCKKCGYAGQHKR